MKEKLLSYVEIGYQTELTFRREDASFSAFGNSDRQGSTWLTAFVLRSFLLAKPHLPQLDTNVTSQAAHWLIERQLSDGSFDEPGEVHYKPLQGVTGDGQPSLTAFVSIALSEDASLAARYSHQIKRAERYLTKHAQSNQVRSVHELALITYALHRLHSDSSSTVFNRLWQLRFMNDQHVWWSNGQRAGSTSPGNKMESNSNAASGYLHLPAALDVEASAYALLTLLMRQDVGRALPVLSWLVARQNANGGFQSTQDTLVGLQAMAALANKLSSSTNQMKVRFRLIYSSNRSPANEATSSNQTVDMQINAENALSYQWISFANGDWAGILSDQKSPDDQSDTVLREEAATASVLLANSATGDYNPTPSAMRIVKQLPVAIEIEANGVGSAVAQVSWQYNLLTSEKQQPFHLHYELDRSPNSVAYMELNVCGL